MPDVSIVISGAAGQGVQTVEQLLVGIFKMAGYHVFATKEYESRVRGGANSTELRVGDSRVTAFVERMDLAIPMNAEQLDHLDRRMGDATVVIGDEDAFKDPAVSGDMILMPITKKALEVGNRIYANVVVAGVVAGIFNVDATYGERLLEQKFSAKGDKVVEDNIRALNLGLELGRSLREDRGIRFDIQPTEGVENEILLNGNQAVGLGAIAGGCNFISAYPMSPSTGVLDTLAEHSDDFGIVVDQAEDEIAAMNKAVAAWYAGARALVSTSGGGFALMTEGLSLAGMLESPLVIHLAQRPGPATGLPTRTAQEDLNHAIYSGHGEFCRMVFAPGTIEQAFYLTQKAFDIADRYQIPVFILTDQDFVDAYYNIPALDPSRSQLRHHFVETSVDYRRYSLTEDGLSPRGVPGFGKGLVRADSDEHDEQGHITEDLEHIRPAMVEKRVHKRRALIESALEPPTVYPEERPAAVVCWGSNHNVVKEALHVLGNERLAMVHFHQVYPLHHDAERILGAANEVHIFEDNATGQFANLLKLHANIDIPSARRHLRYSGKPWSVEEVVDILQKEGY